MDSSSQKNAFSLARAGAAVFALQQNGFCLARNLAARPTRHAVAQELDGLFHATPFCTGDFCDKRTNWFGPRLAVSQSMAELVMDPIILDAAQHGLGAHRNTIRFNAAQAIEIYPGTPEIIPHPEKDLRSGASDLHEYPIDLTWPVTTLTGESGAIRIRSLRHASRTGAGDGDVSRPCVYAAPKPDDAIASLGSTSHRAAANLSRSPRRALDVGYSFGLRKPYENHTLAHSPAPAKTIPHARTKLAGNQQHCPDLGSSDGRCHALLLEERVPERLGTVDALRPDQAAALAWFLAEQGRRADDSSPAGPAPRP